MAKAEELRIEAVMLKQKPDLMPWARYILEDMQREEAEKDKEKRPSVTG